MRDYESMFEDSVILFNKELFGTNPTMDYSNGSYKDSRYNFLTGNFCNWHYPSRCYHVWEFHGKGIAHLSHDEIIFYLSKVEFERLYKIESMNSHNFLVSLGFDEGEIGQTPSVIRTRDIDNLSLPKIVGNPKKSIYGWAYIHCMMFPSPLIILGGNKEKCRMRLHWLNFDRNDLDEQEDGGHLAMLMEHMDWRRTGEYEITSPIYDLAKEGQVEDFQYELDQIENYTNPVSSLAATRTIDQYWDIVKEKFGSSNRRKSKVGNVGFVYIVKCFIPRDDGSHWEPCKIGLSINPDKRMIEIFGTNPPYKYEIIHLIPTQNMYKVEKQLHRNFADKRVNGEWFDLDNEDIEWIRAEHK